MLCRPIIDMTAVPLYVYQRGNHGQPCFFRAEDYRCYLQQVLGTTQDNGCLVHAYALMGNQAHLLITPNIKGALARSMESAGRKYAAYFASTYRHAGALWEDSYKCCQVDSQGYLLTCYRYIELRPVQAGTVDAPDQYPWTSYHANASGVPDALVRPHQEYLALGATPEERQASYRGLFDQAIGDDRQQEIREHLQQQRALGTRRFQAAIEAELERAASVRPPRRGRKRFSTPFDFG